MIFLDEVLAQIYLLVDCINKKIIILKEILSLTGKQTELITVSPNDNSAFDTFVSQKRGLIEQINDIDAVFADIFEKIRDFMGKGNIDHRRPMLELQSKITEVAELTAQIKTMEEKNMRLLTGGVRKPPKKLVSASHAVSAYKKNKKF